jgi:surface polysaccharide O-acyltransferase-like enzyme
MSKQRWQFIIQVAATLLVAVLAIVFFYWLAAETKDQRSAGILFWYVGPVATLLVSLLTFWGIEHFFSLPE